MSAQQLVVPFAFPPFAGDMYDGNTDDPRMFREHATITVTIDDGGHRFTIIGTLAAPPRIEDTP